MEMVRVERVLGASECRVDLGFVDKMLSRNVAGFLVTSSSLVAERWDFRKFPRSLLKAMRGENMQDKS